MTTILEHLERASCTPQWLIDLALMLDGETSEEGGDGRMRRFGDASQKWSVLDADDWTAVNRQFCDEVGLNLFDF